MYPGFLNEDKLTFEGVDVQRSFSIRLWSTRHDTLDARPVRQRSAGRRGIRNRSEGVSREQVYHEGKDDSLHDPGRHAVASPDSTLGKY